MLKSSLCYIRRYKTLGNLPHVMQWSEYCVANPGFAHLYQLVNVEDLNGVGESDPTPYFYQVTTETHTYVQCISV